jgi:two-component system, chemotaxis family, response regulator Rcp1
MTRLVIFERPIYVFAAEDNPADLRLLQEALEQWETPHELRVARDGDEMIQILEERSQEDHVAQPADLIILDCNMPKKNGFEVLREIKCHPTWKFIPVIMLSCSAAEHDIREAYGCYANSFVVKPSELQDFFEIIKNIETFWLRTSHLATIRRKIIPDASFT